MTRKKEEREREREKRERGGVGDLLGELWNPESFNPMRTQYTRNGVPGEPVAYSIPSSKV